MRMWKEVSRLSCGQQRSLRGGGGGAGGQQMWVPVLLSLTFCAAIDPSSASGTLCGRVVRASRGVDCQCSAHLHPHTPSNAPCKVRLQALAFPLNPFTPQPPKPLHTELKAPHPSGHKTPHTELKPLHPLRPQNPSHLHHLYDGIPLQAVHLHIGVIPNEVDNTNQALVLELPKHLLHLCACRWTGRGVWKSGVGGPGRVCHAQCGLLIDC